jgi:hypothetical protein
MNKHFTFILRIACGDQARRLQPLE